MKATGTAKGSATATGVMRLKTGFATSHLQIAAHSARSAYEIEKPKATGWFDEMMRLVPVSVVMAGAALEANANELIQDILDNSVQSPPTEELLKDLKDDHSGNAWGRYRRLALLMDEKPNTGTAPWHNAMLLVKFRNEFMHFRPSWDSDDIHNGKLVKDLKKKVPVAAAYKSKGNFLFPYGFMTYGCAKWAVQTVLTFSSTFTKLLGVTDKFSLPGLDFKLP
jgi:hypothetical protein